MCELKSIVVLGINIMILSGFTQAQDYEVPPPKINVYSKGFTVSIPDEEGISLFAFHGNINKPMEHLEAGRFSKDILRKKGHEWVFNDTRTTLKTGDKIYYWLFVIRDGLGYRYDDGEYTVNDILSPTTPSPDNREDDQTQPKVPAGDNNSCCELYGNSTRDHKEFFKQIAVLAQTHKILFRLVEKNSDLATTLLASGHNSEHLSPKEFVNEIVKQKLNLHDVTVVRAEKGFDNVITFSMKSLNDKIKVIIASEKLKGSDNEIIW